MTATNFKTIFVKLVVLVLVFFLSLPVAASISQGFISDDDMISGTIVSFDIARPDYVVKANTSNIDNLLGVVVQDGEALLSANSIDSNVDIIVSGEAFILVSTLNGSIEPGDKITLSPISGVGMKAISRVKVIGTAQETFSTDTENIQTITVTDSVGDDKVVDLGIVRAQIDIQEYIPSATSGNPFFVALQDAAQVVTGRSVSLAKTIIASGIMISSLMVVVMILMGSTQGTMISLGRNPLAKRTIFSTMIKFVSVSMLIFVGGIISAYLILIS